MLCTSSHKEQRSKRLCFFQMLDQHDDVAHQRYAVDTTAWVQPEVEKIIPWRLSMFLATVPAYHQENTCHCIIAAKKTQYQNSIICLQWVAPKNTSTQTMCEPRRNVHKLKLSQNRMINVLQLSNLNQVVYKHIEYYIHDNLLRLPATIELDLNIKNSSISGAFDQL